MNFLYLIIIKHWTALTGIVHIVDTDTRLLVENGSISTIKNLWLSSRNHLDCELVPGPWYRFQHTTNCSKKKRHLSATTIENPSQTVKIGSVYKNFHSEFRQPLHWSFHFIQEESQSYSLVRESTAPIKRDPTTTAKTYILDLLDNKIKPRLLVSDIQCSFCSLVAENLSWATQISPLLLPDLYPVCLSVCQSWHIFKTFWHWASVKRSMCTCTWKSY